MLRPQKAKRTEEVIDQSRTCTIIWWILFPFSLIVFLLTTILALGCKPICLPLHCKRRKAEAKAKLEQLNTKILRMTNGTGVHLALNGSGTLRLFEFVAR